MQGFSARIHFDQDWILGVFKTHDHLRPQFTTNGEVIIKVVKLERESGHLVHLEPRRCLQPPSGKRCTVLFRE